MYLNFARSIISILNKGFKFLLIGSVVLGVIISFFYYASPKQVAETRSPDARWEQIRTNITTKLTDPTLEETDEGKFTKALYTEASCAMLGIGCHEDVHAYSEDDYNNSLTGKISGLLTIPFTTPVASSTYFAHDAFNRMGFIPDTYAAEGLGFAGIVPLMDIWRQARNLAFLVISIIMIIVGFLVMFRTQINPQAVVGIESALPKLILTMILIHFSFAIAGFMFDLMYILIGFLILAIGPLVDSSLSLNELVKEFLHPNIWDFHKLFTGGEKAFFGLSTWAEFFKRVFFEIPNALLNIFGIILGDAIKTIIGSIIGFWLLGFAFRLIDAIATWIAPGAGGTVGTIAATVGGVVLLVLAAIAAIVVGVYLVPIALGLLIFISTIIILVRLIIMFFSAYIKLVIYISLAPIFIVMEALPGQSAFKNWLRNIIGELLMFPIAIGIMLVGMAIVNATSAQANATLFKVPFIPASINPGDLSMLIGMGIVFLIPDFILITRNKIVSELIPVKTGPGIFVGGVGKAASGATKKGLPILSAASYIKPLRKMLKNNPIFDLSGGRHP